MGRKFYISTFTVNSCNDTRAILTSTQKEITSLFKRHTDGEPPIQVFLCNTSTEEPLKSAKKLLQKYHSTITSAMAKHPTTANLFDPAIGSHAKVGHL